MEPKYILLPAFTKAQWEAENPLLKKGEIGVEINDAGQGVNLKIGEGYWNALPYITNIEYPYDDAITNIIGDVKSSQLGFRMEDIIRKMISPFAVPVISNVTNNAGGVANSENIIEIGSSLSGNVRIAYAVSNYTNLQSGSPIWVEATVGHQFSNLGYFAYGANLDLSVSGTWSPTSPLDVTISIKGLHEEGETNIETTKIRFVPKIVWGVSPSDVLDGAGMNAIGDRQTLLTTDPKADYDFNIPGYFWIAIPEMLSASPLFVDKTLGGLVPISFVHTATVSMYNGVGTYNYDLYRSEYSQLKSGKIAIV